MQDCGGAVCSCRSQHFIVSGRRNQSQHRARVESAPLEYCIGLDPHICTAGMRCRVHGWSSMSPSLAVIKKSYSS